MKKVTVKAPATIANFGPGFDIFAISLENPRDIITTELNDTGAINISILGRDEGIPSSPEANSAGIAATEFFKRAGTAKGVNIKIGKQVRSCSGLGTSGASAVACVYGLNKLLDADLSPNGIIDIARQGECATGSAAHADNVAGCLLGGFVMIKSYSPFMVERMELPDIPIVISVMKKTQKTTRGLIPDRLPLDKVKEQMSCCASLVLAILSRNLKKIGEAINTDHISEPVRSSFIPGYNEIKKKVLEAGAYGCNVSGGGSSVFALCEEDHTEKIAEVMESLSHQHGLDNEIIITRSSNTGLVEIDEAKDGL